MPPKEADPHYVAQFYAALEHLRFAYQWFTPNDARWLLENRNGCNRPLRCTWRVLRQKINEFLFRGDNGETMIYNRAGEVMSAQHRLKGIAEGKHAVAVLCVYGVDPTAFPTLDQGARRSGKDVLSLLGKKYAQHYSSALSWANRYAGNGVDRGCWHALPNERIQEIADLYPGMEESVRWAVENGGHRGTRVLSPGVLAFVHYTLQDNDPDRAPEFMKRVVKGADLPELSWEFALRRRLLSDFQKTPHYSEQIHAIALVFKAFNFARAGRPVVRPSRNGKEIEHTIVWKADQEDFPELELPRPIHDGNAA